MVQLDRLELQHVLTALARQCTVESVRSSSGYPLIRVERRLQNADVPESERNCHAGPKALVALIHLEYWIVNARDLARRVVRSCMACVRFKPKLENQRMGLLLPERVQQEQPFQKCGIDFCGPFNTNLCHRGKGPTKAAHFGFLWEAAVKSAKSLLYRTLINSRFTFEERCTITAEVEAMLNSRPLSPLCPDPNDHRALTPGHFLVEKSLRALP
ncbi:uncharacterized protein [Drosophila suzukii]|uniref:Zinc finger H2C2-type histone UAS binding domain-containing protein n=1 Tax=Drosophila suzukii TaxID=28584 RepID=A0ABM4TNN6_DROSZ